MIEAALGFLERSLLEYDTDIGILFLVGLSMSAAHFFALLANRLSPRQIAVQLVLDGLVLAVALLLGLLVTVVLLTSYSKTPVAPALVFDTAVRAMGPGMFYVFVAAPFISDLIAVSIWFLIHLNVVILIHARWDLPYGQALALATPGYVLALLLVATLFHQSWQGGYRYLASELDQSISPPK